MGLGFSAKILVLIFPHEPICTVQAHLTVQDHYSRYLDLSLFQYLLIFSFIHRSNKGKKNWAKALRLSLSNRKRTSAAPRPRPWACRRRTQPARSRRRRSGSEPAMHDADYTASQEFVSLSLSLSSSGERESKQKTNNSHPEWMPISTSNPLLLSTPTQSHLLLLRSHSKRDTQKLDLYFHCQFKKRSKGLCFSHPRPHNV